MLCLWHKGTLTAREVWERCAHSLRVEIQLLDPKEVSNTAQPILTMPTLVNKRGTGTDCSQGPSSMGWLLSTTFKIRSH